MCDSRERPAILIKLKKYKMYKPNKQKETSLSINKCTEGETIQTKVSRITNNKEPIKDGAPRLYTSREEGVRHEMDIRTDKFEVALDTMTKGANKHREERSKRIKGLGEVANENMKIEDGGAESTDTTK